MKKFAANHGSSTYWGQFVCRLTEMDPTITAFQAISSSSSPAPPRAVKSLTGHFSKLEFDSACVFFSSLGS